MLTTLRVLALPIGLALVLTSCSGGDPEAVDRQAAPSASVSKDASAGGGRGGANGDAVSVKGEIEGTQVEVRLGPVVREGDLAVLQVDVAATAGEQDVYLPAQFGFTFTPGPLRPANLRLVDIERQTVSLTAHGANGFPAVKSDEAFARPGGDPVVFHAVFAAPSGDTTDVLVPHLGLVEDVPVVDAGGDEASVGVAEVAAVIDTTPERLSAPVRPLEVHRERAEGTVRSREVKGRTTVAIATDVLFAKASADLSPKADDALKKAGRDVTGASPGKLTIVGHTDDVGTEQHNQDLSERRARAVAERLGALTDLSSFDVQTEGRAYREPAVAGTSNEARALNRRVELEFATPEGNSVVEAEPAPGAPPAAVGPVGTVGEGVVVGYREGDGKVRVKVERIRRAGSVLVGDLRVERVEGQPGVASWAVNQGTRDARGLWNPQLQTAATGVTLLVGDMRVFPLDYQLDDKKADRHPLAELGMRDPIEVGEWDTATIVWPDVGADTVTVDLPPILSAGARTSAGAQWRIPDVPVEE